MNDGSTGSEFSTDFEPQQTPGGPVDTTSPGKASGAMLRASRVAPRVVSGVSVSGDAYAPTLTTAGTQSTGTADGLTMRSRKTSLPPIRVMPKLRHTCHALFSACVDNLDRALDHREDYFLRNNALEQLKDTLSHLWQMRTQREEPFAEVVNMLQAIFAQRQVEDFSTDQLTCLRSAFDRLQRESDYDDEFANTITAELLGGGIDVFREIK